MARKMAINFFGPNVGEEGLIMAGKKVLRKDGLVKKIEAIILEVEDSDKKHYGR